MGEGDDDGEKSKDRVGDREKHGMTMGDGVKDKL